MLLIVTEGIIFNKEIEAKFEILEVQSMTIKEKMIYLPRLYQKKKQESVRIVRTRI